MKTFHWKVDTDFNQVYNFAGGPTAFLQHLFPLAYQLLKRTNKRTNVHIFHNFKKYFFSSYFWRIIILETKCYLFKSSTAVNNYILATCMTPVSGQLQFVHDIRIRARRRDVFASQKNWKIQVGKLFCRNEE